MDKYEFYKKYNKLEKECECLTLHDLYDKLSLDPNLTEEQQQFVKDYEATFKDEDDEEWQLYQYKVQNHIS